MQGARVRNAAPLTPRPSATAAVIANGLWGLVGFGAALLALHLAVVPLDAADRMRQLMDDDADIDRALEPRRSVDPGGGRADDAADPPADLRRCPRRYR